MAYTEKQKRMMMIWFIVGTVAFLIVVAVIIVLSILIANKNSSSALLNNGVSAGSIMPSSNTSQYNFQLSLTSGSNSASFEAQSPIVKNSLAFFNNLKTSTKRLFNIKEQNSVFSNFPNLTQFPNNFPSGANTSQGLLTIKSIIVNIASIKILRNDGVILDLVINPAIPDTDGDGFPDIDLLNLNSIFSSNSSGTNQLNLIVDIIPLGTYTELIILSPTEQPGAVSKYVYIVLSDGTKFGIRTPGQQQHAFQMPITQTINVQSGISTNMSVQFNPGNSLQFDGYFYILKPTYSLGVMNFQNPLLNNINYPIINIKQ